MEELKIFIVRDYCNYCHRGNHVCIGIFREGWKFLFREYYPDQFDKPYKPKVLKIAGHPEISQPDSEMIDPIKSLKQWENYFAENKEKVFIEDSKQTRYNFLEFSNFIMKTYLNQSNKSYLISWEGKAKDKEYFKDPEGFEFSNDDGLFSKG